MEPALPLRAALVPDPEAAGRTGPQEEATKPDMALRFWKRTGTLLVVLNALLVGADWVMAFYVYPRLPSRLAARMAVFGWEFGPRTKSVLFFLVPFVQMLVNLTAVTVGRVAAFLPRDRRLGALREEHISMAMIFINVVFIHLERNVISLAYAGRSSLNFTYLVTLGVIIVLIFFYYRLRRKTAWHR
jgi:hypothetical protein